MISRCNLDKTSNPVFLKEGMQIALVYWTRAILVLLEKHTPLIKKTHSESSNK